MFTLLILNYTEQVNRVSLGFSINIESGYIYYIYLINVKKIITSRIYYKLIFNSWKNLLINMS